MDFGNELVNTYIQRVLAYNNDLVNQLMLAESKLAIVEKRYSETFAVLKALKEKYEPEETETEEQEPDTKETSIEDF